MSSAWASTSGLGARLAAEALVAFAGDWHGDARWVQRAIPALARHQSDVRTILHVGDLGIWSRDHGAGFLGTVDYWLERAGIERLLLTPGNHDDWGWLAAEFAAAPRRAVLISERVWALPRGFRFEIGGRRFLSFGGAASMDFASRAPGRSWWPEEAPTEAEVAGAIGAGSADVLVTHDMVDGGTAEAEAKLDGNEWPSDAQEYSASVRSRITRLWEAVQPRVLVHGHMHVAGERTLPDGRRIYSMNCEWMRGNLAVLSLGELEWAWISLPGIERTASPDE